MQIVYRSKCRLTYVFLSLIAGMTIPAVHAQSISEGFDNVPVIFQSGWEQQNRSEPLGPGTWKQDYGNFNAPTGHDSSSIVCAFESTDPNGTGTISNWLFTPVLTMNDGDTLRFRTISFKNNVYPDRMEVRISFSGSSTNVGASSTSTGDFDTLIMEINPDLTLSGYPVQWQKKTIAIDVPAPNTMGRIAFRYFVTDGGGEGSNSSVIGIDDFIYQSITDVGVEEVTSTIVIYPNPTETKVRIESTQTSISHLEITDMKGNTRSMKIQAVSYELQVKDWAKGIYLLKVYWENQSRPSVHKLIVQ